MKINLKEIIKNKKTYPNWTTSTEYELCSEELDKNLINIYYIINKGVQRKIQRTFPKIISIDPQFTLAAGLIKGEGSNSLGKSSYRRFTFTNSNPEIINFVLSELEKKDLFRKKLLIDKSIHLIHTTKKEKEVIKYWSKRLNLPKSKFKCFDDKMKTSDYGVCHIYISDVLLRRVIDLIIEKIINQ